MHTVYKSSLSPYPSQFCSYVFLLTAGRSNARSALLLLSVDLEECSCLYQLVLMLDVMQTPIVHVHQELLMVSSSY